MFALANHRLAPEDDTAWRALIRPSLSIHRAHTLALSFNRWRLVQLHLQDNGCCGTLHRVDLLLNRGKGQVRMSNAEPLADNLLQRTEQFDGPLRFVDAPVR